MPEHGAQNQHDDPMDERHDVPGKRRPVRKAVWIAAGLVIMFLIAMGVASTTIGILDRPGKDPGAYRNAPSDRR